MSNKAKLPRKTARLSSEDWDDVADLLSQFAQQCEIAFEEHRPNAKRWLAKRLQAQAMTAQGKSDGVAHCPDKATR